MYETPDTTDLQLLKLLQKNAKLTTKELADAVNLTPTPVFERIKRLESEGYIKKYVAILDPEKMGRGFLVFCSVKLKQMNRDIAKDFVSVIKGIPEVTACYNVAGEFDYILTIYYITRDTRPAKLFVNEQQIGDTIVFRDNGDCTASWNVAGGFSGTRPSMAARAR